MKVICNLELNYDSSSQAKQIFESVHVDDDAAFMKSKRNKKSINTCIKTKTVSSMLHTIDDFLACIRVAEKIIEKNQSLKNK